MKKKVGKSNITEERIYDLIVHGIKEKGETMIFKKSLKTKNCTHLYIQKEAFPEIKLDEDLQKGFRFTEIDSQNFEKHQKRIEKCLENITNSEKVSEFIYVNDFFELCSNKSINIEPLFDKLAMIGRGAGLILIIRTSSRQDLTKIMRSNLEDYNMCENELMRKIVLPSGY